MNVIIPLGGKGERFLKYGYDSPKALINIGHKKMIDHLLDKVCKEIEVSDQLFIIYSETLDNYGFSVHIKDKYKKIILIPLYYQTKGAAETIKVGLDTIIKNEEYSKRPTILLDCDTFYLDPVLSIYRKYYQSDKGNVVFSFQTTCSNPIYSYIECESDMKIRRIVEKEKISNYANTGAYAFRNAYTLHHNASEIIRKGIMFRNEPYTSCIIDHMLTESNEVFYCHLLDEERVVSLGTPHDVDLYLKNRKVYMFDLDGTIVNTDEIYFNVWKQILLKYNILLTVGMFKKYIYSNNDMYVVSTLLHNIDVSVKDISRMKDELFIKNIDDLIVIDGVVDFFKKIYETDINACIVTNCNYNVASQLVDKIGISQYVDFIISCDMVKLGKPDAEPYLFAMKRYHVSPNQCIVFEDSKAGIMSALNAGVKQIIGLTTNYDKDTLKKTGVSKTINNYIDLNIRNEIFESSDIIEYINNSLHQLYPSSHINVDQTKLKGGFIADVICLTIKGNMGEIIDCVAKYDNINDNGLTTMAKQLQLYDREYYFYEKVAPFVPVNIPRYISLIRNDEWITRGMILENMFKKNDNYVINLDLNTQSIDLILRIVDRMAKLHSTFWGKDLKRIFPQLKKTDDTAFYPFFRQYIDEKYPIFKEKWQKNLTTLQKTIFDHIFDNFVDIQLSLSNGSLTFIHGDIKSPNLFYDKSNNNEPCFIDWQHCGIGKGTQDLVFFILESFDIKRLKSVFDLCIPYYYMKIQEYGVKNYKNDEYQKDIKNSLYYVPFFTSVWFGSTPTDELIDPNWPFFFIQKVGALYEYEYTK